MINDILNLVTTRLNTEISGIKYIDQDWGQLDYYNDSPPVAWPCVLIELQGGNWRDQAKKVQDAVLSISLTVADIRDSNTSFKSPTAQKERANQIWVLLENIHKALHGWKPQLVEGSTTVYGTLSRVSNRKLKRDDGIRQFEIIYSFGCVDSSALEPIYNIADPVVSQEQFNIDPPGFEVVPEMA